MVTVEREPVEREERRGQSATLRRIWRLHFWVALFAAPTLVLLAGFRTFVQDGRVVGIDVPSGQPHWLVSMPGSGSAEGAVTYLSFDCEGHLYASTAGGTVALLDNGCPTMREQAAYTG
jgi:hypothetical protein